MTDSASGGESHELGRRAARNTVVQSAGELAGILASAALFFAMTRRLGQANIGAYVTAISFVGIVMVFVDLGLERYVVRAVARDHAAGRELFWNALVLKLWVAVPAFGLGYVVLGLLPFSAEVRETAYVLAAALLFNSMTIMVRMFFVAHERGAPVAWIVVFQRVLAAALGFIVLAAGGGVRTIAATFAVSTLAGFILAISLAHAKLGRFPLSLDAGLQRSLLRVGLPYVSQDVFTVLLFRLDAVLLAALGTQAAVGRYGAAYMLMDATSFVKVSLVASFAAMFTYLGPTTEPTVSRAYAGALKFSLVLLVPVAVTLGTLALPLARLLFGAHFEAAGHPLRLLAPVVVLLTVGAMSSSLIVSRRSPAIMVAITALVVAVNATLNVALIPGLADSGAALAMLVTGIVYGALTAGVGSRTIGERPTRPATLAGPMIAGLAMGAVMLALSHWVAAALPVGVLVYLLVLVPFERTVNPVDFAFADRMLRRRAGPSTAGHGT